MTDQDRTEEIFQEMKEKVRNAVFQGEALCELIASLSFRIEKLEKKEK